MKTQNAIELIPKQVDKAFGKDVYLLGKYKTGEYFWLEQGKWDCDWYWGFGYIETYQNNRKPSKARDIDSHSHYSGFVGKKESYDFDKKCFVLGSDYRHHLYDDNDIAALVLTENESWQLADLMKSFYTLQDAAEIYHQGNSHITTVEGLNLKNKEAYDRINKIEIPAIMEAIYKLLTPNK